MRCDTCKSWEYRYQEDMGVCTRPDGPGEGVGLTVPVERAVLSKDIKKRNAGKTATTCDTTCNRWEQM